MTVLVSDVKRKALLAAKEGRKRALGAGEQALGTEIVGVRKESRRWMRSVMCMLMQFDGRRERLVTNWALYHLGIVMTGTLLRARGWESVRELRA